MQQHSTILFVDSDVNQLHSLQRTLRDQRDHWRMLFAKDSDSALSQMAQEPVDILVSETRLDGGTGGDLLKLTHTRYPRTTRLLFSGQSTREPAQEVVRYTHQFIAKPCDRATLIAILQRVMQLRSMLHNPDLRQSIHSLGTLPSLPDTYFRLIDTLRSDTATVQDVGRLVEQDLAMSTKVLQMVNSAFFGLRRRIASPVHAVSLLGIETVTHLTLTAGIFSQLQPTMVETFDLHALWQHSLRVSGLARAFCRQLGMNREESELPVLAGLLHDLGKLVLITADNDAYRKLVIEASREGIPLHLAEAKLQWADHAAIGAYLMGLWGLPLAAVEAVALHHKAELQHRDQPHCLAVYAANLLIHHYAENHHQRHYDTGDLQAILGSDLTRHWCALTREYLDGETA